MDQLRDLQACEVLQLVVQHCRCVNTPKQLCTLLLVSSQVNAALRQCRGTCSITAHLSAFIDPYRTGSGPSNRLVDISKPWTFARFAAWLPAHAGLVQTIILHQAEQRNYHYVDDEQYGHFSDNPASSVVDEPGVQLLETALQLSTTLQQPGSAAAGQATPVADTTSCLPLQLQSFHSDYVLSPKAVRSLVAAGVKSAHLRFREPALGANTVLPSLCAAIGQLTALQELSLETSLDPSRRRDWTGIIPQCLVTQLGKLQMLTSLKLDKLNTSSACALPVSLRTLDVTWAPYPSGVPVRDVAALVDLGHLTALHELRWHRHTYDQAIAVLPPQLAILHCKGAINARGWDKVKTLHLHTVYGQPLGMLHQVQLLTGLQHLSLHLNVSGLAQLALHDAVALVSTMADLTTLEVVIESKGQSTDPGMVGVPLCASLRNMCKLQKFGLCTPLTDKYDASEDLVHLTVLTQIKHLDIWSPALDDFNLVAVLSSLTSPQHLQLTTCNVRTSAFVPVLASLTNLTWLGLADKGSAGSVPFDLCQHDILQLSELTQLQHVQIQSEAAHWDRRGQLTSLLNEVSPPPPPRMLQQYAKWACTSRGFRHDRKSDPGSPADSRRTSDSDPVADPQGYDTA